MTWKPEYPILSTGINDLSVLRLRNADPESRVVELRGSAKDLEQIADLLSSGEKAREYRMRSLATGTVGYYVVALIGGQLANLGVRVPAPGIKSFEHLGRLQADMQQRAQAPVQILHWTELEETPQITIAQTVPAAVASN